MEIKLKPCPFCGGEAKKREESAYVGAYVVKCSSCGAGTWIMSECQAILQWNRRYKPSQPEN